MNKFVQAVKEETNFKRTENGAVAHKSTLSDVYDLFAFGGAYRERSDEDIVVLFSNALKENPEFALKCLFYLRDVRGGQGERRFFRVAFNWLCKNYPSVAKENMGNVVEFGRWDDVLYATENTPIEDFALKFMARQLITDLGSAKAVSLAAKWAPSINAHSVDAKRLGRKLAKALPASEKEYRLILSYLRGKINVLEKLMSANRWEEIEFDMIPSKAGLKYRNAFARRDVIAKKYEAFVKSDDTKVNADSLYPYEVVHQALSGVTWYGHLSEIDRAAINKYWANLKDYFNGKGSNMLCMVDTSGSMSGNPIEVAISLGMYAAERNVGPWKDYFMTFASSPRMIKIEGVDFVDKVKRIEKMNLCDNTNLAAGFNLLRDTALAHPESIPDMPDTLVVISDMEIDDAERSYHSLYRDNHSEEVRAKTLTAMERIRAEWQALGLKTPKLVYWNVDARNNTILDSGELVSYVSGLSPVLFEQVLSGKTSLDLMLDKLNSPRYNSVVWSVNK